MVKAFLEEGSIVHFCARDSSAIETANKSLATDFPSAKAIGRKVDVSNQDELTSWVKTCAEESGSIDVVVSNVSALSMPDTAESWTKAFQTDILGLHTLIHTALPYLEKSKGNIVSINSVSGRDIDVTGPGPYGATKAAAIHYIASLAHSLAPKGVRANSCSPGNIYIEDGTWGDIERAMPEMFKSQFEKNVMGRMGKDVVSLWFSFLHLDHAWVSSACVRRRQRLMMDRKSQMPCYF